jgi:hypothetical protein
MNDKNKGLDMPEGKLGFFWIVGAVALTGGAWLIGQDATTVLQNIVAFVLILTAGLCWIGVSVGVVHRHSVHRKKN